MAEEKVIFKEKAQIAIREIAIYIELNGYPETAEEFSDKLYEFGFSLAIFPDKYPLCKHPRLLKIKMHCAVFHKNYIFIYKWIKKSLVIYNVVNGRVLG